MTFCLQKLATVLKRKTYQTLLGSQTGYKQRHLPECRAHTPYSKMAANKLFFFLHVILALFASSTCIKKQKNFEVKMKRRGLINMQTKE